MTTQGDKRWAVADKDGKKQYFDIKSIAKTFRNALIAGGFKGAHVTYGPDHPLHHANRSKPSWNKGRHPKATWRGKGKGKEVRKFG